MAKKRDNGEDLGWVFLGLIGFVGLCAAIITTIVAPEAIQPVTIDFAKLFEAPPRKPPAARNTPARNRSGDAVANTSNRAEDIRANRAPAQPPPSAPAKPMVIALLVPSGVSMELPLSVAWPREATIGERTVEWRTIPIERARNVTLASVMQAIADPAVMAVVGPPSTPPGEIILEVAQLAAEREIPFVTPLPLRNQPWALPPTYYVTALGNAVETFDGDSMAAAAMMIAGVEPRDGRKVIIIVHSGQPNDARDRMRLILSAHGWDVRLELATSPDLVRSVIDARPALIVTDIVGNSLARRTTANAAAWFEAMTLLDGAAAQWAPFPVFVMHRFERNFPEFSRLSQEVAIYCLSGSLDVESARIREMRTLFYQARRSPTETDLVMFDVGRVLHAAATAAHAHNAEFTRAEFAAMLRGLGPVRGARADLVVLGDGRVIRNTRLMRLESTGPVAYTPK